MISSFPFSKLNRITNSESLILYANIEAVFSHLFNPSDYADFNKNKTISLSQFEKLFGLYIKLLRTLKIFGRLSYIFFPFGTTLRSILKSNTKNIEYYFQIYHKNALFRSIFDINKISRKISLFPTTNDAKNNDGMGEYTESEDSSDWEPDFLTPWGTFKGNIIGRHYKDELHLVMDILGPVEEFTSSLFYFYF